MSAPHSAAAVYLGTGVPHDGIEKLPPPPPWRTFGGGPLLPVPPPAEGGVADVQRARSYQPDAETVQLVNAALLLRRPLLLTGRPGVGKSSLAYSIAHELRLGPVLRWNITRSTTLGRGLYEYDAIGRLQDSQLLPARPEDGSRPDVGNYVRLGPLGTALLPADRPRVLLIDDLDQGDFDLPHELLTVLEAGEFVIPELDRLPATSHGIQVWTDDAQGVSIPYGRVRCQAFPMVVITSSGEREFPPRFLRRCLNHTLHPPTEEQMASIVAAHMGVDMVARSQDLIQEFLRRQDRAGVATDRLLNAIFLATSWEAVDPEDRADVIERLLRSAEAE